MEKIARFMAVEVGQYMYAEINWKRKVLLSDKCGKICSKLLKIKYQNIIKTKNLRQKHKKNV